MRLTSFADYSLRLLIYLAGQPEQRHTITAVASFFDISAAHLKKVVQALAHGGFLTASTGRKGGIALSREPDQINLADVIIVTEPDFGLFECYLTGNRCRISRPCRLPTIANAALDAFLGVLRKYSLADVMIRPEALYGLLPPGTSQPQRGPKALRATA